MPRDTTLLVRVEVDGCRPRSKMVVQMMYPMTKAVDAAGYATDAVWRISVPGLSSRYARLQGGRKALEALLTKYSFADDVGCTYSLDPDAQTARNLLHNARKVGTQVDAEGLRRALGHRRGTRWLRASREAVLRYAKEEEETTTASDLGTCHFLTRGIAQLSEASGICWYSSMFWSILASDDLRQHVMEHIARRRGECEHCAYLYAELPKVLHSQAASEAVRRYLYEKLCIGDCPDQAPELDGQNGASMAMLLCGALKLPITTVLAPWMKDAGDVTLKDAQGRDAAMPPKPGPGDKRAILLVRTYRSRWAAPEHLEYQGRKYRLVSALVGSEYCGHQVAISRSCEPDTWSVSDSDGIRLGVLPLCFRRPRDVPWHRLMKQMIPVSNSTANSNFCDMAPGGRHPLKLMHDSLKAQGLGEFTAHVDTEDTSQDLINVDYWYLSE